MGSSIRSSTGRASLTLAVVVALLVPLSPAAAATRLPVRDTGAIALTAPVSTAGIPLVTDIVQAHPTTEEQAQAMSDALAFAEDHPDDVGYPYIDPVNGSLELSTASAQGEVLLANQRSAIVTQTSVRQVKFSYGALESIKHDVTTLRGEGVPDADLIYQTAPDHESNRIVITVKAPSARLFKALAARYGTEAIALQINADGWGAQLAGRQNDSEPYWGGALISTPNYNCSDAFAWQLSSDGLLTAAHCISTGGTVRINGNVVGTVNSGEYENWDDVHGTQYYSGQSTYRGDVALIKLNNGVDSAPAIYRGGKTSSSYSYVLDRYNRYSLSGDVRYIGGAATGETGPYTVDFVGIDVVYNPPSDVWARNITSAVRGTFDTCANHGDSGGSVFSLQTGGVWAAGVFSGFLVCRVYFTDIYRSYLGLPGDVMRH